MFPRTFISIRAFTLASLAGLVPALIWAALSAQAQDIDNRVLSGEAKRIAVIAQVRPSVVAIFAQGGQGGGSGVLISKDGYALTNFHVVEGSGPTMLCGLPDGILYDAVLVGLDKVGDVALIKLLPQKPGQEFPFASMGDSDKLKAGDWSLAMGNPFLLATDFNPTVTFGLISGVHRYQYPAGTLLEYTDCIQVDTSINPGNSGGPLFNMDGELIGINGRGSFEKRGRVNSGVGYAISINQIKNFMGHLRAGIDTDHATLGALIESESEEGSSNKMVVKAIVESDAHRRGLEDGDELVSFAGRPITTVNQYKNVLGLFPKGWRVPLVYRHENDKREVLVRLMQLQRTQQPEDGKPKPKPAPPRPPTPARKSPAIGFYEPKPGFANYHFNKLERDRLWTAFHKSGDFTPLAGDWILEGQTDLKQSKSAFRIAIREELEERGPGRAGSVSDRSETYHFKAASLPPLPDMDPNDTKIPLREAVRKAAEMLRQHAKSFPQEVWAEDTPELMKDKVIEQQKNVATIQAAFGEMLEELTKVAKDRDKESKLWQAHYDYNRARLTSFLAYIHEYNFVLAQLRKEAPPRDPKVHRGWRMVPQEKLQSGPEARKLAQDADKIWEKMLTEYKGTSWQELARRDRGVLLGLQWQPTGGTKTVVHASLGGVNYDLDPLKAGQEVPQLKVPTGSGGFLAALYLYRRLLILGAGGFEGQFSHGGYEPFYPPPANGKPPKSLNDLRVDAEVLLTEHAAITAKWYFSLKDQTLLGFEASVDGEDDPCEVYLSDYQSVEGRMLPHRMVVQYRNGQFGTFAVQRFQLAALK
jgi:S1-C subfamily serine protease